MKYSLLKNFLILFIVFFSLNTSMKGKAKTVDYVVMASNAVMTDKDWKTVVDELLISHPEAKVVVYKDSIQEALGQLKVYRPRYVAVVDKPEAIGKKFVVDLNKMSRKVNDDIYADFMSGIITSYDAKSALRMVKDARTPFVMKNTVSTISNLGNGKWFDNFVYLTDARPAYYYVRKAGETDVKEYHATDSIQNMVYQRMLDRTRKQYGDSAEKRFPKDFSVRKPNTLEPFYNLYNTYSPDVLITASHATEYNLEMPFSSGNLLCKDGRVYADMPDGPRYFQPSNHPRVYLPVGNCLIGNVNHTNQSMVPAWTNSERVDCMVGYVVTTWYGRNGWGGLRTLLTQPGRYTVAEAFFLNQQDLMERLRQNAPDLLNLTFPFVQNDDFSYEMRTAQKLAHRRINMDQMGQWYDRDVVAYYGDPAWNARLQNLPDEQDVAVSFSQKGKNVTVIIKTSKNFSLKRMEGGNMNKENLQPQPFTYIFPNKLDAPTLKEGQSWKAVVNDNFLLLYDTKFEPNSTYTIKLKSK